MYDWWLDTYGLFIGALHYFSCSKMWKFDPVIQFQLFSHAHKWIRLREIDDYSLLPPILTWSVYFTFYKFFPTCIDEIRSRKIWRRMRPSDRCIKWSHDHFQTAKWQLNVSVQSALRIAMRIIRREVTLPFMGLGHILQRFQQDLLSQIGKLTHGR